jgi:quercetin dioxygenase-like cupin family protein
LELDKKKPFDGPEFSEEEAKDQGFQFYPPGEIDWAVVKESSKIPTVVYNAPHKNYQYTDERGGRGLDYAKWVLNEEPGWAEGLAESPLELFIDAYLEPNASVGEHFHSRTEELYYILEGSMELTVLRENGQKRHYSLSKGDAHLLKVGQGHFAIAGNQGVRFITVGVRKA